MTLRLEEKVAQLFVVGSDTPQPAEELEPFYRLGLGGILLFRHHLQPFESAFDVRAFLEQEKARFGGAGLSFVSIDQEGGQVERTPHWFFPTGIIPVVFGMKRDPAFCEQVNREVARRLRWLGINVNFTPTVDLNLETMNPIIGVRAYGTTPEQVLPFATRVMAAHWESGVLPVAKHFPGHGSGTVDSHESLPVFERWEEQELAPYEALIRESLPAVLVAHGLYPKLARQLGANPNIPASLSEPFMTTLLREKLGFQGLVFTDDLMMGAVWGESDPVEVALMALEAGADMLVYRRAQPEAWLAFEAIVSRVRQGKLSETLIDDRLSRILAMRQALVARPVVPYTEDQWTTEACQELSLAWAQAGLVELQHQFMSPLPLSQFTSWGLVAPDRTTMRHYEPDRTHGNGLVEWCRYYGIDPMCTCEYSVSGQPSDGLTLDWMEKTLDTVVFVGFNSHLSAHQQQLYRQVKQAQPKARIILASAGMPTDGEVLSSPWVHVQLPSFRPAALQAFVQWLISTPKSSV